MTTNHEHADELTIEEIEAEAAEALPERAAMSTVNITNLDTAGAAIEAVGDGAAPEAAQPVDAPVATDAAPLPTETPADPVEHGPPASVPGAEHSAAGEHAPQGTPAAGNPGHVAPAPQAGTDT